MNVWGLDMLPPVCFWSTLKTPINVVALWPHVKNPECLKTSTSTTDNILNVILHPFDSQLMLVIDQLLTNPNTII